MTWSELIRPPRLQHSETDKGKQRTAAWRPAPAARAELFTRRRPYDWSLD
jgi:hypothetical protein